MGTGIKNHKYLKLTMIAGLVVIIDQVTKAMVIRTLQLYDIIVVIPGFFNITHLLNPGGSFGFLADQSKDIRSFLFIFVASLAVLIILYLYRQVPDSHPWLATGLALVFGGAIGNLIDRVRIEKVVDFLDFHVGDLHWPTFNIADSAITIGVAIFIYHVLLRKLPDN